MPSVYCTACGAENPEGARFCSHCGTALVRLPADRVAADTTSTISLGGTDLDSETNDILAADAAAVAALPPGTALLAVLRGPNTGARFLLDSDLTLAGRHPDSDIFLDDVTVSRRHAEFYRQGGRFVVRDVGSLNGTYVNRERIEEAELHEGDEVQVGKFRLVFLLGPAVRSRIRRRPAGRGMNDRSGYLGISEVLAQLRADFPDVSVSKIRFLESEGLVEPARSPSGYRRFCAADVDRLRYILTAQRDQYLPLRVIKERLDRLENAGRAACRSAGRSGRARGRQ